jgi:hypothetical protein
MPDILIRSANLTASVTTRPLEVALWKFRRCPYPRGLYTILVRSNGAAGGVQHMVQIGTTEVVQRSDTSVGGTDGVMPTPAGTTSTPAHQFYAQLGDEIVLELYEIAAAGSIDVTTWANVEPA